MENTKKEAESQGKNALKAKEQCARASLKDLPVSTKHSVELGRFLRYKKTSFAKNFLEELISLKRPVPFVYSIQDLGHKPGMAAGRYPCKAAKEFLCLIKSAEANAQSQGLNAASLKITKLIVNKASIPFGGGRHRHGTKCTHLEIEVKEGAEKEKRVKKNGGAKKPKKSEEESK